VTARLTALQAVEERLNIPIHRNMVERMGFAWWPVSGNDEAIRSVAYSVVTREVGVDEVQ